MEKSELHQVAAFSGSSYLIIGLKCERQTSTLCIFRNITFHGINIMYNFWYYIHMYHNNFELFVRLKENTKCNIILIVLMVSNTDTIKVHNSFFSQCNKAQLSLNQLWYISYDITFFLMLFYSWFLKMSTYKLTYFNLTGRAEHSDSCTIIMSLAKKSLHNFV